MSEQAKTIAGGLVGEWQGVARTWMDPDGEPVTSDVRGRFRYLFERGAVAHEYQSQVGESRADGMMILGLDIASKRSCLTWVNTFHTGSEVMLFAADDREVADGLSFRGSYAAGDQVWGWRVVVRTVSADEVRIEHFNISPDGDETPAIEVIYRRDSGDESRR